MFFGSMRHRMAGSPDRAAAGDADMESLFARSCWRNTQRRLDAIPRLPDRRSCNGEGYGANPAPMTRTPVPVRHRRTYGDYPLPTGAEALDEPFAAFPSWFLRIGMAIAAAARCRWSIRRITRGPPCRSARSSPGCTTKDAGGLAGTSAELLRTGIEGVTSRPVRRILLREGLRRAAGRILGAIGNRAPPGRHDPAASNEPMPPRAGDTAARGECRNNPATCLTVPATTAPHYPNCALRSGQVPKREASPDSVVPSCPPWPANQYWHSGHCRFTMPRIGLAMARR